MSGRGVHVFADLAVEVDGRPVDITADGRDVDVRVADPAAVLASLTTVPRPIGTSFSPRASLRKAADGAAEQGLTVTVHGPDGVLLAIGAVARPGRVSRVVSGSEHVAVGRSSVLWHAARPSVGPIVRRFVTTRFALLRLRFPASRRG